MQSICIIFSNFKSVFSNYSLNIVYEYPLGVRDIADIVDRVCPHATQSSIARHRRAYTPFKQSLEYINYTYTYSEPSV